MKMGIPVYVYPSPLDSASTKILVERGARLIDENEISNDEKIMQFVEDILEMYKKE